MALFTIIPNANYPAGTRTFGPVVVPLGASRIWMELDRSNWTDPNRILKLEIERSFDGGTSWESSGAVTTHGGDIPNDDGSIITATWLGTDIPGDTSNPDRRLRATITIAGGPIRTTGTILVE